MLNKAKASVLKTGSKIKSQASKIHSFFRKYRWRIFKIFLVLATIAMIVSLVLSAIKGVRIFDQAVIINHTESRILNGSYTNQQVLIGLGSSFFTVPRKKFLITFGENIDNEQNKYHQKPIIARVVEGTKIQISAKVSCKIQVDNLKNFVEEYGLNWQKYIIGKVKNSIIQSLAITKFYDLNNTRLIAQLNQQFNDYQSLSYPEKYPFHITFISLKLGYPQQMKGQTDTNSGTMGIQLILKNSEYTQLSNQYTQLTQKISSDGGQLQSYCLQLGKIQGQLIRYEKSLDGSLEGWRTGLDQIIKIYDTDQQGLRQFMWIYFQKMYNSTYNTYEF